MQIIERGKVPINLYRHRCSTCKTLFEYNDDDIKRDRGVEYVLCPLKGCGKYITVYKLKDCD